MLGFGLKAIIFALALATKALALMLKAWAFAQHTIWPQDMDPRDFYRRWFSFRPLP